MMAKDDPTRTNPGVAAENDAARAMKRVEREAEAMHDATREGVGAVKESATSLGRRALGEAQERSEKLKDEAAHGLRDFADAIRKAADDLSKKQPGIASDLVGQAASGLEGLSRSLQSRSTGQMVDDLREFGRTYPGAFIAGSILAGIAIGRFAGSSATHQHSGASASAGSASRTGGTASGMPTASQASSGIGGAGRTEGSAASTRYSNTEASHGKH